MCILRGVTTLGWATCFYAFMSSWMCEAQKNLNTLHPHCRNLTVLKLDLEVRLESSLPIWTSHISSPVKMPEASDTAPR